MKTHRIEIRIEGGRTYYLTAQHSEVLLEGGMGRSATRSDGHMFDPPGPALWLRTPTRLTLKAFGVTFLQPPDQLPKPKKRRPAKRAKTRRK